MKKRWYLLRVDNPLDHSVEITIKPERLLTKEQVIEIIANHED